MDTCLHCVSNGDGLRNQLFLTWKFDSEASHLPKSNLTFSGLCCWMLPKSKQPGATGWLTMEATTGDFKYAQEAHLCGRNFLELDDENTEKTSR